MADTVRVGIIGGNVGGWAGRAHMPALAAGVPGVELVAVSTTRQESADEAAAQFGARRAYADHRALLADPEVDVAAVSVKLPMHDELTRDVIAAGKHVYTEWPLGTTTEQAVELAEAAADAGVRSCVGLQSRYSADYVEIRRLIASGAIGEVLTVNLTQFASGALSRPTARLWMRDESAHANTLSITFGHAMDGLVSMVGPVRSVAAVVRTQVGEWTASDAETGERFAVTAPDNVLVSGVLASGAGFSVHVASVAAVGTGHRLEVHGSKGTVTLGASGSTHLGPGGLRVATEGEADLREASAPQDEWVRAAGLKGPAINIGKLWAAYAASLREGGEFHPDFTDAVAHHRLIDAVQRASDTGRVQRA